ncbi:MAG: hypothetical protein S4CHLAM6_02310 [Chlamydiae bacterium]|nr:hypothetical protein [Chlamydiota bacterium]
MSSIHSTHKEADHIQNMQAVIDFAKEKNKIWPFAAAITTKEGKILCKATDCAHISPLFHAETLAIHALVTHNFKKQDGLILYSTTEPDLLSLTALYWAQITHELKFDKIVYGADALTIQELWAFDLNMPVKKSQDIIDSLNIEVLGPILEEKCNDLFCQAKDEQVKLGLKHPGRLLSNDSSDFYTLLD